MITWALEARKIKQLKKYAKNPRSITHDQFNHLKLSLDKFGLIDKPIINLDDTIIGGHQRIEVLKRSGSQEIECWVPNRQLEVKEVEELCLRLNRVHGEFDYEILANEFEVPELLDWGFTVEELQLDGTEEDPKEEEKKPDKETKECPNCGHIF